MVHSAVQKLIIHKKLIGTAALGIFVAVVFIPGFGFLAPAHAANTVGQDHGGVVGTGSYGNGHPCYARTNGLPEGCRTPT